MRTREHEFFCMPQDEQMDTHGMAPFAAAETRKSLNALLGKRPCPDDHIKSMPPCGEVSDAVPDRRSTEPASSIRMTGDMKRRVQGWLQGVSKVLYVTRPRRARTPRTRAAHSASTLPRTTGPCYVPNDVLSPPESCHGACTALFPCHAQHDMPHVQVHQWRSRVREASSG